MEFKAILSGKDKIQILDKGFRLKCNKPPKGPLKTSYFTCVTPGCSAKAATLGDLNVADISLKYHRVEQHNHPADISKNIVAEKLHEFRENAKVNPDKTAKSVYERLTSEAINSVETPDKQQLAAALPKFHVVKDQHYRQRKKLRPKLPKTLEEVDIPSYGDLTLTERGHAFYRGKTESGVELFISDTQTEILTVADTGFIDGTFKAIPEPMFQGVFLRVKVGNNRYTVGVALLPNKQQKT